MDKTIIAGLVLVAVLLIATNQSIFADFYSWNISTITLPWSTISAANDTAMTDRDRDGYIDSIYTFSAQRIVKQFGYGQSSIPILSGGAGTLGIVATKDNLIATYNYTAANCINEIVLWKIDDGSRSKTININVGSGTADPVGRAAFLITSNNQTYTITSCAAASFRVYLDTVLITSGGVSTAYASPLTISTGTTLNKVYTFNQTVYSNASAYDAGQYYKTSSNTLVKIPDAGTLGYPTQSASTSFWAFPYTAQIYRGGLALPANTLGTGTLMRQYEIDPASELGKILTVNPRIYNSVFTANTYLFVMEGADGTLYLGAKEGTTIYYTPYSTVQNQLLNRAYAYYRLDTSSVYYNLASTGTITTVATPVIFPNSSSVSFAIGPNSILPSGYYYRATASLERYYYPQYTNSIDPIVPIYSTGGTHTTFVFTIRNAPEFASVKFVDSLTYANTGVPFVHAVQFLQADKTTTVSLENSRCLDVFVADASQATLMYSDIGTICASGATSKTLVYTTDLAFTFWTLPWGTSSEYDDSTSALQTLVRNSAANYTYNLRVYDRNGTLSLQQQYTNVNGLDIQTFNITSIQKPATLQILDESNNTLYHTTMGFGNWLDDFQAFSNQQLTIDGFNLVAMMPIIFAAMWTRNTVSMGTMMTVVMIATLGFFGVLAIPEIVLYLMLFIAAIAMVAYKLLF